MSYRYNRRKKDIKHDVYKKPVPVVPVEEVKETSESP